MRPGTFERVYAAIKDQLRRGLFRPGDRLEPAVLSDELNASVTPVRDALHRLTGERLVEAPKHEGFRAPLLTEGLLRHLYAWHQDLLVLAIMGRGDLPTVASCALEAGAAASDRQNALFAAIVRMSGNPEHLFALQSLTERLGPLQRIEGEFLDAIDEENSDILKALRSSDRSALRQALARYHRRRAHIVPKLLERFLQQ